MVGEKTEGSGTVLTTDPFIVDGKTPTQVADAPDVAQQQQKGLARIRELFKKAGIEDTDKINSAEDIAKLLEQQDVRDKLDKLDPKDRTEMFALFLEQEDINMEAARKKRLELEEGNAERTKQQQADDLATKISQGDTQAFGKVDTNHDGYLSMGELKSSGITIRQALELNASDDVKKWIEENSAEVGGTRIIFSKSSHDEIVKLADDMNKVQGADAATTKQQAVDDIAKTFDRNGDGKLDDTEAKIVTAAAQSNEQFAEALKKKGLDPNALIGDIRKTLEAHNVTHTPASTGETATTGQGKPRAAESPSLP